MEGSNSLFKELRVRVIKEAVPGFKTFEFEMGHGIRYKAGQYLTLVMHHNGEEVRRSYSITSAPVLGEPLTIGVKRVENGIFSRHLVDVVKEGDTLTTTGAGGLFTLPDDMTFCRQVLFFAAGSGITPIYSLIKTVLQVYPQLSVKLIYSNASLAKALFAGELEQLRQQHSAHFEIEWLFSDTANLLKARLHRDLLLQIIEAAGVRPTLYYICGPETYMRMVQYTLQERGVHSEAIRKENFVSARQKPLLPSPPDKGSYTALIHYGEKDYPVRVDYPLSILQAARRQGIQLPYSCETGKCGNCIARCTKGTIWHSNDEVLMPSELQKGLILTCVGHPVGGDVEIVIGNT